MRRTLRKILDEASPSEVERIIVEDDEDDVSAEILLTMMGIIVRFIFLNVKQEKAGWY